MVTLPGVKGGGEGGCSQGWLPYGPGRGVGGGEVGVPVE